MGGITYDPLKSWWIDIADVSEALWTHDRFAAAGAFDIWRENFAANAKELAQFFYDNFSSFFPPSRGSGSPKGYDLASLETLFSAVTKADLAAIYKSKGSHVFAPWTNWFFGDWDNYSDKPAPQYHIWDNTISMAGRYIQPVTQSTREFAYSSKPGSNSLELTNHSIQGNLQKLIKDKKTDIAVDVCSKDYGITGWVTKLQKSPIVELGHIGYLIDDTSLIWIAQDTANPTDEWAMFFERGDKTSRASRYSVDGILFNFKPSKTVKFVIKAVKGAKGSIRFTCQKPYSKGSYSSREDCG